MPQPFITNSLKRKIDNFSKKPGISKYLNRNYRIKKMQWAKFLKLYSVVDERGQKIESVNSELEDRSIEFIQYKQQRKKQTEKMSETMIFKTFFKNWFKILSEWEEKEWSWKST